MIRRGEIPAKWEDARRALSERLADIVSVLDRGFKAHEQFREVKDVEIDTDALPLDIEVRGSSAPLAVLALRVVETARGSSAVVSGPAVLWEWTGTALRIHGVADLSASTRYLVTLALVE